MAHGTNDDLVPWQQSVKTIERLREKGVECDVGLAAGAGHSFDLFAGEDLGGTGEAVVERGYGFLMMVVRGVGGR